MERLLGGLASALWAVAKKVYQLSKATCGFCLAPCWEKPPASTRIRVTHGRIMDVIAYTKEQALLLELVLSRVRVEALAGCVAWHVPWIALAHAKFSINARKSAAPGVMWEEQERSKQ